METGHVDVAADTTRRDAARRDAHHIANRYKNIRHCLPRDGFFSIYQRSIARHAVTLFPFSIGVHTRPEVGGKDVGNRSHCGK